MAGEHLAKSGLDVPDIGTVVAQERDQQAGSARGIVTPQHLAGERAQGEIGCGRPEGNHERGHRHIYYPTMPSSWTTPLASTGPSSRTSRRYHRCTGACVLGLNCHVPRGLSISPSCPMASLIRAGVGSSATAATARSSTAIASYVDIANAVGTALYAAWYAATNRRFVGLSRSAA